MSIEFSVIICTRNRAESLARNLDSLLKLRIPDGLTYEILVVDNGSSDGTRKTVEAYIKKNPDIFKYCFEEKEGLSNARNCAVEHAAGSVLAFIDDDVIVHDGWMKALHDAFSRRTEAIAVQGKVLLQRKVDGFPQWLGPDDFCTIPYYNPLPAPGYSEMLLGANMAIRKEAFRKYGLFDPHLGVGASGAYEETEFSLRLKEGGEKVFYQPGAAVFHEFHPARLRWDYLFSKQSQLGHSRAYIDVVLKSKEEGRLVNWKDLIIYFLKYGLYTALGNKNKRFKYCKRIHFMRNYISMAAKLRSFRVHGNTHPI